MLLVEELNTELNLSAPRKKDSCEYGIDCLRQQGPLVLQGRYHLAEMRKQLSLFNKKSERGPATTSFMAQLLFLLETQPTQNTSISHLYIYRMQLLMKGIPRLDDCPNSYILNIKSAFHSVVNTNKEFIASGISLIQLSREEPERAGKTGFVFHSIHSDQVLCLGTRPILQSPSHRSSSTKKDQTHSQGEGYSHPTYEVDLGSKPVCPLGPYEKMEFTSPLHLESWEPMR